MKPFVVAMAFWSAASGVIDGLIEHGSILQFGALGVLMVVLALMYRLAAQYLEFVMRQKNAVAAPRVSAEAVSYSEQMARTIYDVNRSLTEVSVATENNVNLLKHVIEQQDAMLEAIRSHCQETSDFISTYKNKMMQSIR